MIELNLLENNIGYKFKDKELLIMALTHKSYAYEQKYIKEKIYNERLEFLGDAIIEHIISEYLFNIKLELKEGEMTKQRAKIVCEKSLSNAFRSVNGEKYIFLGKCEIATDGRKKDAIIADAFESLIAAIYIDSDFYTTKNIVLKLLHEQIKEALSGETKITDYKTMLQELLQKNGSVNIQYNVLEEKGPDHDKEFYVEVVLENKSIGTGYGKSRKQAEQKAAEVAYAKYN